MTYGLTKKKELSYEDYRNPNIVARGYTVLRYDTGLSMRGRPVFLHMRKNQGWEAQTNESLHYILELPKMKGTRLRPSSWLVL